MIEVKGIRDGQAKPGEVDRYDVKGLAAYSRIPTLLAALTGGVALYLRSFLPVSAEEAGLATPARSHNSDVTEEPPREQAPGRLAAWVEDDPGRAPSRGMPSDQFDELAARVPMPRISGEFENMLMSRNDNAQTAGRVAVSNINLPPPQPGGPRYPVPSPEAPGLQFPGSDGPSPSLSMELLADAGPPNDVFVAEPVPKPEFDRNRSPINRGPVYLADVATSGILLIGLSDLLRHTYDPDGDQLSVTRISSSSGEIERVAGGFRFVPTRDQIGPVTLIFLVSDGSTTVRQVAYLNVTENPLMGSERDDILVGTPFADAIEGYGGDDNIVARQGDDLIAGGSGDDHIVAGSGDDTVWGGAGNDLIFGGLGADLISGGAGADRLYGDEGDDLLFGDAGDDALFGGNGNDILSGGAGIDSLFGGSGDDQMAGGAGADLMEGGEGADRLSGDAGRDTLIGGAGGDYLSGGDEDDNLSGGAGHDVAEGGAGSDRIAGQAGNDLLMGGEGRDTLFGGSGDDNLHGGEGEDSLDGGTGDDTIEDGEGADFVLAGMGHDTVIASVDLSDDSYSGGEGFDVLDYSGAAHDLIVDMASAIVTGLDVGRDSISGFESVIGGNGSDKFLAANTPVSFKGGDGNDIFDFSAGLNQAAVFELAYQILDFGVGDRVRVARYDFFEDLVDEISDELEDLYEDRAERFSREDGRIRYRHDETDDFEKTLIDFDLDLDDSYEMTVALHGHHLLVIVEHP